jgi:repressor LexA
MKQLTERQKEVLTFITDYISNHSYPPTMREIGEHFGISVKGAYDHVEALRKKSYLRIGDKRSRTIEVIKYEKGMKRRAPGSIMEIPLLGTVAAGKPILAEENYEGTVSVHQSMLKKNAKYFAFRVRGDSMINAGILEGDIAIIEKRETADNQDIVVAVVNEAVTLKRFFKERNRVRLQPENANYQPIYTQDARVLGRLSQIIRNY